jgi:hypothetical protein
MQIDWEENRLIARGLQSEQEWEALFGVMREHRTGGLKTDDIPDAAMRQLSRLSHVTQLSIQATDEGMRELVNMPQLVDLEIGGSEITDDGLQVLPHLGELRRFQSCWTRGISDAGAAHLAGCHRLESVDLMGTETGDGLIRAMAGKLHLRQLKTGRCVSDTGIKLLHEIPVFKRWLGGEVRYGLMSADAKPNQLLVDGPFTDAGLAELAGLDGLFGLSLFWHSAGFSSAGLAHLRRLPKLGFLGCEGARCDDGALREIAAMPQLRMLMGQGAVASDIGWEALSQSESIEYIWGRECPNLTGRGFSKLAGMPALRGIGVSCKNVDDESLALLPSFPVLREIVPMDFNDAGGSDMWGEARGWSGCGACTAGIRAMPQRSTLPSCRD